MLADLLEKVLLAMPPLDGPTGQQHHEDHYNCHHYADHNDCGPGEDWSAGCH
jgi:hypothetical protein